VVELAAAQPGRCGSSGEIAGFATDLGSMDDPSLTAGAMQLPRWSSVINTPKVFYPDKPKAGFCTGDQSRCAASKPDPAEVEFVHVLEADLKRDLRRSIFRQRLWISLAVIEVLALIGTSIWWK